MQNENWAVITSLPNAVEAELLRGMLADRVAVTMRERNELGAAIGLYSVMSSTMYDLLVAATDVETARALLDAYASESNEVTDDELNAVADEMYDERV